MINCERISVSLTCHVPILRRPSVIGILIRAQDATYTYYTIDEEHNVGTKQQGYTYVKAQPNIDDLICAGMSSGPAN